MDFRFVQVWVFQTLTKPTPASPRVRTPKTFPDVGVKGIRHKGSWGCRVIGQAKARVGRTTTGLTRMGEN